MILDELAMKILEGAFVAGDHIIADAGASGGIVFRKDALEKDIIPTPSFARAGGSGKPRSDDAKEEET